ncbi:PilC/PilY family type IV pilus protein [Janthinobacterium sp. J1-1]|uniref:pilus assembly protein n=1 Tax=Janthinobacterium sp. J1-1 TaxID=3065910 RepID=UPI00281223F3|nr:PilC/PilY family type IV pilus protein [Janthinobacterium sp. J1-1]
MMVRCLLVLLLWLVAGAQVFAASPLVDLSRADTGLHGARVPPNLLLNLSLSHASAGAAYEGDYDPGYAYAGYFDARMCYGYPYRSSDGVTVPDWRLSTAYFSVSKAADARHGCGGDSFSGNFLNWAGASLLDIVRYALTGGDRVIDEVRKTVLQRAYLPDGQFGVDFYAHPDHFPRKILRAGVREATPFTVGQLAIVSCRNKLLFGDGAQPLDGSCDAPGKAGALGAFLARVQVCDVTEGLSRPDLCLAYGKNVKPAGALQRHGGRLRVGVFGHASGEAAYGGVLQAPLSYAGAQRWAAPDFLPQDNPDTEWHPVTGVYAGANAVIAHINTQGRSDDAHLGAYAAAAPQAELLYESLRYLQGRQASAAAGTTSWTDPQQASCQRQVVMTLGDAGAVLDRYVPGHIPAANSSERARGVDAYVTPPLDVMAWTRAVGALESDGAGGNPQPLPGLAALDRLDHGVHGGSFYAAGLAYWSHRHALRLGGGPVDHYAGELLAMAAKGEGYISPSPLLLAAKYGGFVDENGDGNPFRAMAGDFYAEWSVDGRWPSHYLPGGDPQALIALLRAAFVQAGRATEAATIAGPSLMALANGAEQAYWFQSQINLADGAMRVSRNAFHLGADGGVVAGKPVWQIGGRVPNRPIHTLDAQGGLTPLAWDRLDTEQRRMFDPRGDGLGPARLDYLLGERTHEVGRPGGFLRRRAGGLAVSPHGNLVHVGTPALGLPGLDYLQHRQRGQQRRKMLYLGTGDGLLHGVDAGSGSELFAYLPQALLARAALAGGTGDEAGPLLDGAAASAEVLVAGRWKTVLASSMGAGAQGLFALDITDPARFAQEGALWEFGDRDDAIIGNLRAPPGFARLNMGGKQGRPAYRDMVVVSSGYNNTQDDGKDTSAASPVAAIFLLALDKPAGAPWLLGSNYHRLKVPVRDDEGAVGAYALAPPALVAGNDGALSYLYAGDLQGNIWRIDMATGPPWKDEVGRKLVFVARDAQGRRQAVTQQLKVAYAPGGGYLLLFGTGKLVETGDTWPAALLPQSFYAVHDDLNEQTPTRGRDDLAVRKVGVVADTGSLAIDGKSLHYTGGGARHGWYLDFVGTEKTGERSVHAAVLAAGKVVFNTVLPGRDPCSRPATRLYVLDVLSGFAADAVGTVQAGEETGKLLDGLARAPPQLLEVGSQVGVAGATGRAEGRKQFAVVQSGMVGAAAVKVSSGPLPAKRLGWREVANWRELHEAAKK